jgi:Ca2+/H+ antiporter
VACVGSGVCFLVWPPWVVIAYFFGGWLFSLVLSTEACAAVLLCVCVFFLIHQEKKKKIIEMNGYCCDNYNLCAHIGDNQFVRWI